ncbi:MAG: hypothetical protein PHI35_08215, partial [Victivallaceae bacterium]|nr:hypothetical protein [Victivallaceae bacterium]
RRGVLVCFYLPPTCREMAGLEKRFGVDYNAMASKARRAGLRELVVTGEYISFDGSHLSKSEAERFSAMLGGRLNEVINRELEKK